MKIIDTFLFFNELDLLEVRLNILNNFVDYFVITESDTTFSGNKKELFYQSNQERFSKFKDKIIYNSISIPQNISVTWDREIYQRNSSFDVLAKIVSDNDLILTSDLDEIPSTKVLDNVRDWYKPNVLYHFQQDMYMYFFNNFKTSNWYGTRGCSFSYLKNTTIDDIRQSTEDYNKLSGFIIENGGWHFTYLGGESQIKYKLESFSHQEYNNDNIKQNIQNCLLNNSDVLGRNIYYKVVSLDDSFPEYILNNQQLLKKFIINDSN